MKTKTTLAALLLAAVMVTPSYGASDAFLKGAANLRADDQRAFFFAIGYFQGYCSAMFLNEYGETVMDAPKA